MNKPYIKDIAVDGTVLNPIKDELKSIYPNRKKRREFLKSLKKKNK